MRHLPAQLSRCRHSLIRKRVDDIQTRFLGEIGLCQRDALVNFNLAPLAARRDMAMLGVIHCTVLGKGPGHFCEFFRLSRQQHFPRSLRMPHLRHNRQLWDPINAGSSNFIRRSALSLIYVYNILPQAVVDRPSASSFQKNLQKGLRRACEDRLATWESCLGSGALLLGVGSFQNLFH